MCYNLGVKKLAALTISCCAALAACLGGTQAAFADGQTESASDGAVTFYPASFTQQINDNIGQMTDYAVSGESYAFLCDGTVTLISDDARYDYAVGAVALDCSGGTFYYSDGQDTYDLSDTQTPVDYEWTTFTNPIVNGDGEYKLLDGVISFCPAESTLYTAVDGTYSAMKIYGGTVYALGGGRLYAIVQTDAALIDAAYTDYSVTAQIPVGDTAAHLAAFNLEELHYVTVNAGAYLTQIDADKLDGTYFEVGDTFLAGGGAISAGESALLLCTAGADGEVSLIASGSACYLLRTENTTAAARSALTDTQFNQATVSIASAYAYASPYISSATQLFEIKSGDVVSVLGTVTTASSPELAHDFYKIVYTDGDGSAHTGYVPYGYVSQFTYVETEPAVTQDPAYTEDNLIKTVVLVLVVIVLVLIAAGYLAFIGTSDRRKKHGSSPDGGEK